MADDSIDVLKKSIKYLEEHQHETLHESLRRTEPESADPAGAD
jgi:hypothetical protein